MPKKDRWVQGYACAVANIIEYRGHNTEHVEALQACGLSSIQALRDVGVEDRDIERLRPVIADIQAKWRHLKKDADTTRAEKSPSPPAENQA